MGECFHHNIGGKFLPYPTAALHLQYSSQYGSGKTYLLEWLTCKQYKFLAMMLKCAYLQLCHHLVTSVFPSFT